MEGTVFDTAVPQQVVVPVTTGDVAAIVPASEHATVDASTTHNDVSKNIVADAAAVAQPHGSNILTGDNSDVRSLVLEVKADLKDMRKELKNIATATAKTENIVESKVAIGDINVQCAPETVTKVDAAPAAVALPGVQTTAVDAAPPPVTSVIPTSVVNTQQTLSPAAA